MKSAGLFYFPCSYLKGQTQQKLERASALTGNKLHFYPTPKAVFEEIVKFTDVSFIGASGRVLKVMGPSCGDGGMIQMLLEYGRQEGRVFDVTGFDIDPINVLVCQEAGLNVVQADFLSMNPEPTMDLIAM